MNREKFIQRCLDLAKFGMGNTDPNPVVGAVLEYNGRIIGEGFHQQYGGPHAEVNAINSVGQLDKHAISKSNMFVSLEPCCIYGNTPPCSKLILDNGIKSVSISSLDQTPGVNGQSIDVLKESDVDVKTGILSEKGNYLSRIRNTYVREKRPYILLKWAQSKDGFLGQENKKVWLSNAYSKRLTHKWRSEFGAILVGRKTVSTDNPKLNNRYYFGGSPIRVVLDRALKTDQQLNVWDGQQKTIFVNQIREEKAEALNIEFLKLDFSDPEFLPLLLEHLGKMRISSLMVEGGAKTLQSFIDKGLWDEARVFKTNKILGSGLEAPKLDSFPQKDIQIADNKLCVFTNR